MCFCIRLTMSQVLELAEVCLAMCLVLFNLSSSLLLVFDISWDEVLLGSL